MARATFVFGWPDEELEVDLRSQLEWLKVYQAGNSVPFEKRKEFEQRLSKSIYDTSRVIYMAKSIDWANPSPERQAVIARIQGVIAPFNSTLLEIGFRRDGESSALAVQSQTLLKYSSPDRSLVDSLRERLHGPFQESGVAISLMFEHRLLTSEDKNVILQQFNATQNPEERVSRALGLSKMGMSEAVPVLADMIRNPFTLEGTGSNTGIGLTENASMSAIRIVTDATQYLGPSASGLLHLLKQRETEVANAMPPPERQQYLAILKVAIDQIEGRRPIKVPTAFNGSGILSVPSKQIEQLPHTTPPLPTTPTPGATSRNLPPPPASVAQPSPAIEHQTPAWSWVGGILALLAVIGFISKRRAK